MGNKVGVIRGNNFQTANSRGRNGRRVKFFSTRNGRKVEARKKKNNPPSAYALFIRDVRNRLFERKVGFRELTVSCSRKWKDMSTEEKQRFHEMAKEVRDHMFRVCGRSQRRTRKDPKKRKKTNYWNFAQIMRPIVYKELKDRSGEKPQMKEVNREVGHQWRQMSQEDKNRYKNN